MTNCLTMMEVAPILQAGLVVYFGSKFDGISANSFKPWMGRTSDDAIKLSVSLTGKTFDLNIPQSDRFYFNREEVEQHLVSFTAERIVALCNGEPDPYIKLRSNLKVALSPSIYGSTRATESFLNSLRIPILLSGYPTAYADLSNVLKHVTRDFSLPERKGFQPGVIWDHQFPRAYNGPRVFSEKSIGVTPESLLQFDYAGLEMRIAAAAQKVFGKQKQAFAYKGPS